MLFGEICFVGIFTSNIGEDESQFDEHIFRIDWNHQLGMF